jgi:chorismate mutase
MATAIRLVVLALLVTVAVIFVTDKLVLSGPPAATSAFQLFAQGIPLALLAVLVVLILRQKGARAAAGTTTVLRGIRGATTVAEDTADAILEATGELVREIVAANSLVPEDVASALFTVTPDLHAEFPAAAARRMGWTMVPLLNFTEIGVPGRLERCIRVLVHVNTTRTQNEMVHVYLREAVALRPDLVQRSATPQ